MIAKLRELEDIRTTVRTLQKLFYQKVMSIPAAPTIEDLGSELLDALKQEFTKLPETVREIDAMLGKKLANLDTEIMKITPQLDDRRGETKCGSISKREHSSCIDRL